MLGRFLSLAALVAIVAQDPSPTVRPSLAPTDETGPTPTALPAPTGEPSRATEEEAAPTGQPSFAPRETVAPTVYPTFVPSNSPHAATEAPTDEQEADEDVGEDDGATEPAEYPEDADEGDAPEDEPEDADEGEPTDEPASIPATSAAVSSAVVVTQFPNSLKARAAAGDALETACLDSREVTRVSTRERGAATTVEFDVATSAPAANVRLDVVRCVRSGALAEAFQKSKKKLRNVRVVVDASIEAAQTETFARAAGDHEPYVARVQTAVDNIAEIEFDERCADAFRDAVAAVLGAVPAQISAVAATDRPVVSSVIKPGLPPRGVVVSFDVAIHYWPASSIPLFTSDAVRSALEEAVRENRLEVAVETRAAGTALVGAKINRAESLELLETIVVDRDAGDDGAANDDGPDQVDQGDGGGKKGGRGRSGGSRDKIVGVVIAVVVVAFGLALCGFAMPRCRRGRKGGFDPTDPESSPRTPTQFLKERTSGRVELAAPEPSVSVV